MPNASIRSFTPCSQGTFINYGVGGLASSSVKCVNKLWYPPEKEVQTFFNPPPPSPRGIQNVLTSSPFPLTHEFKLIHICMYSCVYLIILYNLTCRQTIIEYVIPKDGLRRKQNCIYVRENAVYQQSAYQDMCKMFNPRPREVQWMLIVTQMGSNYFNPPPTILAITPPPIP